ncbi:MAG: esterase-like activity of phytase family protein [Azospirillaceae bacterium]
MTSSKRRARLLATTATVFGVATAGAADSASAQTFFERVATYPVYENLGEGADPATETVAEIVSASDDGMTLAYTDSPGNAIGFVDLTDPAAPTGAGRVALGGEPTSVVVGGGVVYAGVNTAESFVEPSGHLAVLGLDSRETLATCDAGGQPDSVAVSPDGTFVAVVVENERDEDLDDGVIPQLPPGHLAIFDIGADGLPTNCDDARIADLTGLAEVAPSDPEPEYVDINADNVAVVTLQENNHLALVDLASGEVTGHFPAGTVDLDAIDTEDDGIVQGNSSLSAVPREPDAVAWIDSGRFVTADEGDYEGGSRGFTVFSTDGEALYGPGNGFEHLGMSLGHYPDGRADNKGMEPEGTEVGVFGEGTLIFVNSERGNIVTVYRDTGGEPEFLQVLPTYIAPEGLLAIPGRDLFVVATEEDSAEDGIRATISVYTRTADAAPYPHIVSEVDPATGAPIGWGALSGMVADGEDASTVYAVSDSFYAQSMIFTIDAGSDPARIVSKTGLTEAGQPAAFDLEGIALRAGGGFWVASEGRPGDGQPNLILGVAADGTVEERIGLPEAVEAGATNNGFEGVAVGTVGGETRIVAAIQREWEGDPAQHVKLGVYDIETAEWGFVHYPIEAPSSPAGGWVGLSEITHLGDGRYAVIERDNQPGAYSTHKVLTVIDLSDVTPAPAGETPPVVDKTVAIDLLPAMRATNGWISDKPEGLAVTADGTVWLVTDNDGVDDAPGETQFLRLGTLADLGS